MSEQRYRFMRDDDGHDYLIKDEDTELFDKLLNEALETDDRTEFIKKFDEYRSYHPSSYSFVDPSDL